LQSVQQLLPGQQKGHDLAYWLPLQTSWLLRRLVQDLAQDPGLVQSLPIPLLYANRMGRLKWATPTACALLGLTVPPQSTSEPLLLAEQTSRELLALRDQTDVENAGLGHRGGLARWQCPRHALAHFAGATGFCGQRRDDGLVDS
jgi:hypothetical protein